HRRGVDVGEPFSGDHTAQVGDLVEGEADVEQRWRVVAHRCPMLRTPRALRSNGGGSAPAKFADRDAGRAAGAAIHPGSKGTKRNGPLGRQGGRMTLAEHDRPAVAGGTGTTTV